MKQKFLTGRLVLVIFIGLTVALSLAFLPSVEPAQALFQSPPPPPPLEVDLSINPVGSVVPKTGVATISGIVTCSRPAFVVLFGDLQQKVGRAVIRGIFDPFFFACDGETSWSMTVTSETGPFVGGHAQSAVFAFAFDQETPEVVEVQASMTVQLRGSRP